MHVDADYAVKSERLEDGSYSQNTFLTVDRLTVIQTPKGAGDGETATAAV